MFAVFSTAFLVPAKTRLNKVLDRRVCVSVCMFKTRRKKLRMAGEHAELFECLANDRLASAELYDVLYEEQEDTVPPCVPLTPLPQPMRR